MNLRKILLVLPIALTIFHLQGFAQRDSVSLNTIILKTAKLNNDHPTEKVYVHFDKPYYAVGDTIWFKAYVTVDLHVPTSLSKVAYLDIINGQNELIDEKKLQLINGSAGGFIPLPASYIKQGNYHFRAYTKWMRNSDQAYFFNKTVTIASTSEGKVLSSISFKNSISDKISKINAKVVYKDADGNPYVSKKVNWQAENDDGTISKGKGETDKNGALDIYFSSTKANELNSSTISTEMAVDEKRIVTNKFSIETTPPGTDVQFFPEGGVLINGIRSRVAFKIVKPDGLGIDAKGTITDNAGTVIAEMASQHLGMGVFAIIPEANKTYKANLTFADGTKNSYDLPSARAEGINLSVSNTSPDSLGIKIAANDPFFQKNQNKAFYVIAQSGGVVCYAAQAVLKSPVYSAMIPKDKFPTGILQVTILTSRGAPVSERVAFIQHNDQLNLSLKSDKPTYSRRQKVKLLISAKNKALPVVNGDFSVAVIDESIVPVDEDAETTILSNLLLTSDLRGYIEKPNYYFIHSDDKTKADLDILMLTQGYRRFSYKNIIADKNPPVSFLPEQGVDISGTLRSNTGIPLAKGNVRLYIPDKNFSTQAVTDMSGNFRFSNVMLADTSKVTLNARDNPNGNNVVVTVDGITQAPSTQYINSISEIANIDSTLKTYLENAKKQYNNTRSLKEVVITAEKVVKKVSHDDYPLLRGLPMDADHTIPGSRFAGCVVFSDCLVTAGLGITYDNANFYITRDYNGGKKTPMAIYVNGMSVDFNYLSNVNPNEVESVEIFNSDGFTSINRTTNTKGVLVVNMKKAPKGEKISKDQLMAMLPKPYEVNFIPGGYSPTREFYAPKFDNPAGSSLGVDRRSTIFWNPKVITDKDGNASFEFFNADGTGSYRAVIEGIDKDGNIGRFVYRYKVQ